MDYLLVRQKVKDYNRWRAFYDADREAREAAGIRDKDLYRGSDDPDDVVTIFNVADKMRAREHIYSQEIVAQLRACLLEDPEIVFLM